MLVGLLLLAQRALLEMFFMAFGGPRILINIETSIEDGGLNTIWREGLKVVDCDCLQYDRYVDKNGGRREGS